MRLKIGLAFFMYFAGLVKIIDWVIFWNNNEVIAKQDFKLLKERFVQRFPYSLQFLFNKNPEPATIISIIFFLVAGFIFWRRRQVHLFYKIISITAFVFAFWNLFSLM